MFDAVLDLCRFRVRPLAAYRLPFWQIAVMISLLGLVTSAGSPELGTWLPGRIGFCVVYNWVETLLFAVFLSLWLRMHPLRPSWEMVSLLTLASACQLFAPLLDWLPDDVAGGAFLVLMLYSLLVLCNALVRISGMRRLRVVIGVLLFSAVSACLMQMSWYWAGQHGWVKQPASWWNPYAGSDDADSSPGASSSSDSADSDESAKSDVQFPLP